MNKWGAKETSKTSTKADETMIELPQEIKDALMQGYDVYIKQDRRDGQVFAKITFHKVRLMGKQVLSSENR